MTPMPSPTLLVLAAGMGSRYGGLKQIEPVGPDGEAIIDYSIYDALRAGFGRVVFVVRKEMENTFKQIISARFEQHIPVEFAFQELDRLPQGFRAPAGRVKPWGTTHAVLMADSIIDDPFAVINADDFYGAEGYRKLAGHLQSGSADQAMVGFVLRNTLSEFGTVSRGVCEIDENGFLKGVVELTSIERDGAAARSIDAEGRATSLTGDEIVSMNMWGFTPQIFDPLQERFHKFLELNDSDMKAECYLPASVNQLIVGGQARVKVLRTHDAWFGATYREDHSRVVESISRLIRDGVYPERLWS